MTSKLPRVPAQHRPRVLMVTLHDAYNYAQGPVLDNEGLWDGLVTIPYFVSLLQNIFLSHGFK